MAGRLISRKVFRVLKQKHAEIQNYKGVCGLLTPAYSCDDAWNARLQTSILRNVDVGNFAMRLQEKMDKDGRASGLDMDILANKMENLEIMQLDFVETLFQRFRKSPSKFELTDSMSYSLIRSLLNMGQTNRLLKMVTDKVSYGIFLSDYSANLCMSHFIDKHLYLEASQIAAEMMMQEELESPLTRHLAFYSSHLAWKNIPLEELEPEPAPLEDDGEEKWVKVKFIQNPWYDDHWDLPTHGRRLGKTLVALARGNDDTLHQSYMLVGSGLWQKFEDGVKLLEGIVGDKERKIAKEAFEYFGACIENVHTREPETVEPGLLMMHHVMPYVSADNKQTLRDTYQKLLEQLKEQNQIIDLDLGSELKVKVDTAIAENQDKDIPIQESLFRDWDARREQDLENILKAVRKQKLKVSIAERLQKLTETEEKLRYFEQVEKVKLGKQRAEESAERPIKEVKEEEQFVPAPQERGAKMF